MSLLWKSASDRGGFNCLMCGKPIDFDGDNWMTWHDDNPNAGVVSGEPDNPSNWAANLHRDCRRAEETERNMRGERSRPDEE